MRKLLSASVAAMVLLSACSLTRTGSSREANGALNILSRQDWGANAPVSKMKRHALKRITIHHTATKQNFARSLEDKLQGLQKFSQREDKLASGRTKPAWADIPYHYYIDCKGRIGEGRDVNYVGDTNTDYDPTGHVLIVLEGSFGDETPTADQLESLQKLTRWAMKRWNIPATEIGGHKDFTQTLCPGKHLHGYLPTLRESVAGK